MTRASTRHDGGRPWRIGAGRPEVPVSTAGVGLFAVQLGLGLVPADLDDVRIELGDRLDGYDALLSHGEGGFELSLTIVARDLWAAVLQALAATAQLGYRPVRLDARPADVDAARGRPEG
ncbi:hypothetical protein [Microlunatus ginsengisoli]|uniref:Uncharacterized protein n=1 Tax=Microlunatus ginsengisoli TaxID=363863 RepID=A0ABP7AJC0_9ACTN